MTGLQAMKQSRQLFFSEFKSTKFHKFYPQRTHGNIQSSYFSKDINTLYHFYQPHHFYSPENLYHLYCMYHFTSTSLCLPAEVLSIIKLCSETPDNPVLFLMNYLAYCHQPLRLNIIRGIASSFDFFFTFNNNLHFSCQKKKKKTFIIQFNIG